MINFAIIGCGVIGPIHARAIGRLPEAKLVAVADRSMDRANALAQEHHARAYADLQEMLESEDLDIVSVCTPSGMHGEHACQVMRSGRHVIVEKPIDVDLAAIDRVLEVQREMGVKLTVISQRRFAPDVQGLQELVAGEGLGRLVLGNAQVPWWRSQGYYDSGEWRGTRALDGGVLMNQAIHSIDLLCWLMGPVAAVRAYTGTLAHRMEMEDVAVTALRFQSGALGTISATTGAYPGLPTRLEVLGEAGSAVLEDDRLSYLSTTSGEPEVRSGLGRAAPGTAQNPAGLAVEQHARQIADMIRAVREDGTPLVDGQAARHPVEVILAIYQSARSGGEVVIS